MTHLSIITPDMGERVLKTLGRCASLPSSGIVAGQAVASAIDEVLGLASPVYNDIDIFMNNEEWRALWPTDIERLETREPWYQRPENGREQHTLFASRVSYMDEPTLDSDDYSRKLSVAQRELYSIGQTRTEGKLNFVRVEWSDSVTRQLAEMQGDELLARSGEASQMNWLTKVFDMNCTQAAVNLATGQLHVSNHFEKFIRSRQLQVVTGFTPVHSLLRYLKKRDELEVYGDDAMHMRLMRMLVQRSQGEEAVAQVRRRMMVQGNPEFTDEDVREEQRRRKLKDDGYRDQRTGTGRHGEPLSFGRKYFDLYVKHQKLLNQHFLLTRHAKKDLWLLTSKNADNEYCAWADYQSPTVVALQFAEKSLAPSKAVAAMEAGFEELCAAFEDVYFRTTLRRARNQMGRAYMEGMQDENNRKRWLAVVPEHPEFFWATVALPFQVQLEVIRRLRKSFKKLGMPQPWGTLSGYYSHTVEHLLNNEEAWEEFVNQHAGTFEPLCTPLPLPEKIGDVVVRELTTSRDLQIEGLRQHHCVGGYSVSVSGGGCRIVSLILGEASDQRSTMQMSVDVDYEQREEDDGEMERPASIKFYCGQNRTAFNKQPLPQLEEAGKVLLETVNEWARQNLQEAAALLGSKPRERYRPTFRVTDDDDCDIPF
jgi:hypothetical protein